MNMDTDGYVIRGHVGTWHVIDHTEIDGHTFWLLEHDTYGDMAANIIVDDEGRPCLSNVHDGFDEIVVELLKQEIMPVNSMPDDTITVNEMKDYGYLWGGMLPLRAEPARRLMETCTVFLLYENDTDSIVDDIIDIENHAAHGGLFGVEKIEWKTLEGK